MSYSTHPISSAIHSAWTKISRCCLSVSRCPWYWVTRRCQARPSVSRSSAGLEAYSEHKVSAMTRTAFSVASSRSDRSNRATSSSVSIPLAATISALASGRGATGNMAWVTGPEGLGDDRLIELAPSRIK